MPIKYRKDLSDCRAFRNFPIRWFPERYYRVFLWENQRAMLENIIADEDEDNSRVQAMATHSPYFVVLTERGSVCNHAPRWLGELHFVRGDWTTEVVAHECAHAVVNICKILQLDARIDIAVEERVAYIYGELVDDVYRWLWEVDPRPRKSWPRRAWRWLCGRICALRENP